MIQSNFQNTKNFIIITPTLIIIFSFLLLSHDFIDVFHNIFIFKKYISGKWLVPPKPSPNKSWCQMFSEKLPHHFTISYWKNNRPFLCFLFFIIGVNVISMIQRAYYFKDFSMLNGFTPNIFYLVSRACGNV